MCCAGVGAKMAEHEPQPEGEDDDALPVALPPRPTLPPPPDISYTRPSLGAAAPAPRVAKGTSNGTGREAPQDPNLLEQGTRGYGIAITAAISLAVTLIIFVAIGLWLDKRYNPGGLPWFTIAGVILGIFGGFTNMIRLLTATGNRPSGKSKK